MSHDKSIDLNLGPATSIGELASAYFQLTKPRITLLVLISMAIGFVVADVPYFDWLLFLNALLGTFLMVSGTSAFNQYVERDFDKLMLRTQKRPLPMHRIAPIHALWFSSVLIFAGVLYLMVTVNEVAALVSLCTTFIYLCMYTPLKRFSFLNLYVGAIPGALPPVGGWAAATGSVSDLAIWILFAIVFLWQVPHVTAIAWMYLDDYQGAGFCMLPSNDADGKWSSLISLMFSFPLVLLPTLFWMMGGSTWFFGLFGGLSALYYAYYALRFVQQRDKKRARALLISSVIYLPLVWFFLLGDHFLSLFLG